MACNGLFGKIVRALYRNPTPPLCPWGRKEVRRIQPDHLSDKGMPVMSSQVEKRVFEGIDELFQNAEIHSKTKLVFSPADNSFRELIASISHWLTWD